MEKKLLIICLVKFNLPIFDLTNKQKTITMKATAKKTVTTKKGLTFEKGNSYEFTLLQDGRVNVYISKFEFANTSRTIFSKLFNC